MRSQSIDHIKTLIQPFGGLYSGITQIRSQPDNPAFWISTARLGDVSSVLRKNTVRFQPRRRIWVRGSGTSLEPEESILPALAEGLERYCACIYQEQQFVTSSARDLGKEALDLDLLPRCSPTELADPACCVRPATKKLPIRWVGGVCLGTGRFTWIPAVVAYQTLVPESEAEIGRASCRERV